MRPTPPHLAPDASAAIFTSDNEPPADIYIFNSINPQSSVVSLMATLSFPLFFSLLSRLSPQTPYLHDRSPSTTPPPTPFISLNWSERVSLAVLPLLLFIFLSPSRARAGLHFCPRRNFIRTRRGKETKGSRRGRDTMQSEEMNRCFYRAAYDAGAFITIRTGGELTGDTCALGTCRLPVSDLFYLISGIKLRGMRARRWKIPGYLRKAGNSCASNFPTLINCTCVSRDKRYRYICKMIRENISYIALHFSANRKSFIKCVFVYPYKYNL